MRRYSGSVAEFSDVQNMTRENLQFFRKFQKETLRDPKSDVSARHRALENLELARRAKTGCPPGDATHYALTKGATAALDLKNPIQSELLFAELTEYSQDKLDQDHVKSRSELSAMSKHDNDQKVAKLSTLRTKSPTEIEAFKTVQRATLESAGSTRGELRRAMVNLEVINFNKMHGYSAQAARQAFFEGAEIFHDLGDAAHATMLADVVIDYNKRNLEPPIAKNKDDLHEAAESSKETKRQKEYMPSVLSTLDLSKLDKILSKKEKNESLQFLEVPPDPPVDTIEAFLTIRRQAQSRLSELMRERGISIAPDAQRKMISDMDIIHEWTRRRGDVKTSLQQSDAWQQFRWTLYTALEGEKDPDKQIAIKSDIEQFDSLLAEKRLLSYD